MITTIDVETTFDVDEENKITSSPFNGNTLVSVGYKIDDNPVEYLCFYHRDEPPTPNAKLHDRAKIGQYSEHKSYWSIW